MSFWNPYSQMLTSDLNEAQREAHFPSSSLVMHQEPAITLLEQSTPSRSLYDVYPPTMRTGIPLNISLTDEEYAMVDVRSPKEGLEQMEGYRNGVFQKQKSQMEERKPSTLRKLAPNGPVPTPTLSKTEKHSDPLKPLRDGRVSKRGQLRAKLGNAIGSDYRPKAPLRSENGATLALVDDKWCKLT